MSPNVGVNRSKAPAPVLLRGHKGNLSFVAFTSDDQIVSASDEDKTIRLWSLSDGQNKVVREMVVCATATSPNGRWVAIGGRDGRVRLLDLKALTAKDTRSDGRHKDMVKSLAFSPDSGQLASGAQDGTMLLWSLPTLQQVAGPLKGHTDAVWWLCYSPTGSKVASCDRETIQVWDSANWSKIVAINERAWSLAWSSNGNTLIAGCIDGAIKIYNPDTGVHRATCSGHKDVVFSIVLSHNANFFATASWDRTIRLWEAVTFQKIGPDLLHDATGTIHSVSISPDDSHLVSGARDSNVRLWNLRAIAPNLFKDFPLEPNRKPSNDTPLMLFPTWPKRPRIIVPSNTLDHEGLRTPDSNNETSESSGRSSAKSFTKGGFFGLLRPRTERGDTSDDTQSHSVGSISTHSSNSSYWMTEDPSIGSSPTGRSPINVSPLHDFITLPISPTRPRKQVGESENTRFIREIRSNPTHDLTGSIVPEGSHPVSGGSHGDIHKGTLQSKGKTLPVAIKVIKKYTIQGDDPSKQRRLLREVKRWLELDHRNVVPILGTTKYYGDFLAIVSPWVENGSLTSYLDHRNNELTPQLRFSIINDVALGLQYLHSRCFVHGDISDSNILIYASGRACIADFGLSIVLTEIEGSSIASTYRVKGTVRWTAPELLDTRQSPIMNEISKTLPTIESDMYSFGGIMLYVLSGKLPYHYFPRDRQVIMAISQGELPKRPNSRSIITDDQWEFMTECWSPVVQQRPSDTDMVTFVHEQLLSAVTGLCESLQRS